VIHPSSVAVSREHRRAKTDRLDTELLRRGFLGWLRGERGHCTMARVPTIANRMKATLARLGVRNFKPTLRKAAERLATVHTPEGVPLPPNRHRVVRVDRRVISDSSSENQPDLGVPTRCRRREHHDGQASLFQCLTPLTFSLNRRVIIAVSDRNCPLLRNRWFCTTLNFPYRLLGPPLRPLPRC
jgi:hypothetical protein